MARTREANPNIAAARLVLNWAARSPELFAGVNTRALIAHLAAIYEKGEWTAVAQATGLGLRTIERLLAQTEY